MKKQAICTILLVLVIVLTGSLSAAAPLYNCKKLPKFSNMTLSARGINNTGAVTGTIQSLNHAFLYKDGVTQDLGTLPVPYNVWSNGAAINDAGQVAGTSYSSNIDHHGFRYTPGSPGVMLDLNTLPAPYNSSTANGINSAGQVVGTCGFYRAFLWTGGVMQDLGGLNPESIYSLAYGINDAGQVVGSSYTSMNEYGVIYHAFLWTSGGGMQDLQTLPSPYDQNASAIAINAAGQVVGISKSGGSNSITRAFLWTSGGGMRDLGTLPAPYDYQCYAADINATGQVVGYCWSSSYAYHAWIYSGGVMHDLNSLVVNLPAGEVLSSAYGINDRGQIAANGSQGAYILTPVPNLAAIDLLLLD